MPASLLLLLAIVCEVCATTSLKLSEGFTKALPSGITVIGYAASFYLLSLVLQKLPIGTVYAIWSGLGIALLVGVGRFWFGQRLDAPAWLGLGLIVAGIIVLQGFSQTHVH
jgi:small multidrug resistance pump